MKPSHHHSENSEHHTQKEQYKESAENSHTGPCAQTPKSTKVKQ